MKKQALHEFQKTIWDYFRHNKRDFPWRQTSNPYRIFISEVMLQQTQTYRVEPKYREFIKRFPNFKALAGASLADVLKVWQGLGYNRRGKYLWESAKIIMEQYNGKLPESIEELQKLPGIGYATACSISAFAFNTPTVFIETNIRSVFIHFFFVDQEKVHDKDIAVLVQKTLDTEDARGWYWALMDYGAMLKKTKPNPSRRSKHHVKQSTFEGSNRQLRGKILKHLLTAKPQTKQQLSSALDTQLEKIGRVLNDLIKEKLITNENKHYRIA